MAQADPFPPPYRPGHEAWDRDHEDAQSAIGVTDFFQVEGEEVHEVAVGPVHAGIIEPGHFRFQCHGENVYHLEISLGYQHRGIERALVGGPAKRTIHYMETLAGDTTVGHAMAYCQAMEALSGMYASPLGPQFCGALRLNWNGWPTIPAIWARWPATWDICRPCPSADGCAAISST